MKSSDGVTNRSFYNPTRVLKLLAIPLFMFTTRTSRVASLTMSASKSSLTKKPLHIHWFRHQDLRLHDNPALNKSIQNKNRASSPQNRDVSDGILPIFCFDPRFVGAKNTTPFGGQKCSVRRAKFLLDSVEDLRSNLEKNGSGLLVAYGKTEDVMEKLCRAINSDSAAVEPNVMCQQEIASEELAIDKSVRRIVKQHGGALDSVWGSALYEIEDLPFNYGVDGMPDTFTPFRNKVEKNCRIGNPLPSPTRSSLSLPKNQELMNLLKSDSSSLSNCSLEYMPSLSDLGYSIEEIEFATTPDERGVMDFKGGETAALARVQDYIFDKDLLKIYFDTRNGMLGADYSTKFSPWLAHGCLSPRLVAKECRRYEEERGIANKSTYWVVFELLWRDFFRFFSLKHGNSIFFLDGTLGREAHGSHPNSRKWGLDKRHLNAWKEGMTGYPLVDANMRELAATGFMSNRGRQNVASFLAIDMNTDWRYGADHFESLLLDYDVYSNWGNWCSASGMTGGRLNRFNIVKQGKDYDKDGEYVRHWCPELKDVPSSLVHEPWKMSKEQQAEFGVRLGVDYPNPLVQPTVQRPYDKRNGGGGGRGKGRGGRGGGKQNGNKRGGNNPNRGRGQRQDMKSLKQGNYDFS